ncbi:LLM class flavin-dependent oxidoreductase [Georgenia thermotolerans]|uniref:LLM class flavin-dependent oxidoreductase n=1 Tax=Georgenia thermotolerans TaxID=527326 RepID=A0A7J5UU31_9MICO|nr:LLM class flavin-dependent oxidoreductase [Georgenia thermotolerans]KAE8765770.1 LLM class flavin-dependent oxidoreductase [Georgenia thermotolerans]
MDYGHPLHLGVTLAPTTDAAGAVALARRAEALGLDLVTVPDHPDQPQHDAWTLLSWVAAATERIHLAPTALDVPARPAAVVGRAAASLDLLSGGRLDLGLGTGTPESRAAAGAPELDPGESVDALREAIAVVRGIWAAGDPPLTLGGEHYQVAGAERGPAPAHHIPVWVGGDAHRLLRLVGRTADGWLVPPGADAVRTLRRGNRVVDETAAAAGRDPREIRRLLTISGEGLAGPAARWVEELLPLVLDDGAGTILLATDDPAALELFAAEVAPALREAVAAERAARGVRVGTVPSALVRARRRPGIAYDDLPAALREAAVEPGDARYPTVRSGYMRAGAPGLVLQVRTPQEVAAALAFARTQPVPLSVRSGGHGISGRSTNDGGIVIDLSRMDAIDVVDAGARLVRVEAGARWGEVAAALRPHGWAISSGDYGGVGVGGLATAGGIGFLGREHGLTIDHVRAAEVVLADGSLVRASATEHPDLFWAVRGAGFAVGVVTAVEFEADAVGDVGFAQLVFDATDTAGFLARWGAAVEAAPRDVTSFLIMGAPRGGRLLAQTMTVVDSDDPDTILARLQPFAALAPLVGQQVQLVPYAAVVSPPEALHAGQGEPVTRSGLLEHVTADFAADAARLLRSGESYFFQIRAMGGAIGDVDPDATAFAHRSANFSVVAFGADRDRLDAIWDGMQRHFSGIYVSFETDRRPERVLEAYPPRTLERLREVKRRYDPGNVFRDNLAIAAEAAPVP